MDIQKLGAPEEALGVPDPQLRLVWAMAMCSSEVLPDTIKQIVLAGRKNTPPSDASICFGLVVYCVFWGGGGGRGRRKGQF